MYARRRIAPAQPAAPPLPADVAEAIHGAVLALRWPLGRNGLVATLTGSLKAPPSGRRSPAFGSLAAAGHADVKRWVATLEREGALESYESEDGFRLLRAVPDAVLPRIATAASRDAPDDGLVERLREWRRERARADEVPAYVVLHDATLRALAAARPASTRELAGVKGFGAAKIERYGDDVLAVIAAAAA